MIFFVSILSWTLQDYSFVSPQNLKFDLSFNMDNISMTVKMLILSTYVYPDNTTILQAPQKKLITRLVARYLVKLGSTSWKKARGSTNQTNRMNRMELESFIQVWKEEFCWCVFRLFGHIFLCWGVACKKTQISSVHLSTKKTRGSSKLEKTNHTLFCCCRLACWKCSPFKVLPDRLWNCWLRATVWYIVMQLGALSGCYGSFDGKSFCFPLVTFTFLDIQDVNPWNTSWLKKYSSLYSFCHEVLFHQKITSTAVRLQGHLCM